MRILLLACLLVASTCLPVRAADTGAPAWFDNSGRDDVLAGGVKMIPIHTPSGDFRVWTKRVGNNSALKVLLLHGGPGATHEYFEAFDSWFPGAGIEYYYYDQLGSAYSDQPADMTPLLGIDRYVDEVDRCARRWAWTVRTSACWATRGVASSPSSTH